MKLLDFKLGLRVTRFDKNIRERDEYENLIRAY